MIGVAVRDDEIETATEFFQLFKTPWEVARPGKRYRAMLSSDHSGKRLETDLLVLFGSAETSFDREAAVPVRAESGPLQLRWRDSRVPVHGAVLSFDIDQGGIGLTVGKDRAVGYRCRTTEGIVWRIGCDLFGEIRRLLTSGQLSAEASIPTLELYIDLVRQSLREEGIAFVEIPPRPAGCDFVCCLTHDVDFYGIRRHRFDLTLGGFIGRASIGSIVDFIRRRRRLSELLRNWAALASLPLVFLGIVRDPWRPLEAYAEVERGRRATFFLVPFKKRPGVAPDGRVRRRRAVSYQLSELRDELLRLVASGHEVAVHGIDAWRDSDRGRAELNELRAITKQQQVGVRMHWLFFDESTAGHLEKAGFAYDSTQGYNDAVGYRAGTCQPFRLPGSRRLMELPLSIMDTALFYPGRMDLGFEAAMGACERIVEQVRRFGGVLVINWHGRSLAPERLWGRFYRDLLSAVGRHQVWFATAEEAVRWFSWRRSICFASSHMETGSVTEVFSPVPCKPGATIRVWQPSLSGAADDHWFDGRATLKVAL